MNLFPQAILFDLDDTLFDHQHASACALNELHAKYAAGIDAERFAVEHAKALEKYHVRFLAGELSLDQARAARMIDLFATFGVHIDAAKANEIALLYRAMHQENRRLVPGAKELMEALQGRAKLAIVTNNSIDEQWNKLRYLGIADRFDAVVISEEIGITKPAAEIFNIALSRMECTAKNAVVIGDNWDADIMGAIGAGIPAVWFNRLDKPRRGDHVVAITTLTPVQGVLTAIHDAMQAGNATPGATPIALQNENSNGSGEWKTNGKLETLAS